MAMDRSIPIQSPALYHLGRTLDKINAMGSMGKGRLKLGMFLAGSALGGLTGYQIGKRIKKLKPE